MKVLRRIPSLNLGGEDVVQLVGGDVADADADADADARPGSKIGAETGAGAEVPA